MANATPYEFYVNPFELLDCPTGSIEKLNPAEMRLRKAKLNHEIELGDGHIPWMQGFTATKARAYAVLSELDDPARHRAHTYIIQNNSLLRFLSHGDLKFFAEPNVTRKALGDKAFIEIVSEPFARQYGRALSAALQTENHDVLRQLSSIKHFVSPRWQEVCFDPCRRSLESLIESVRSLLPLPQAKLTPLAAQFFHGQVREKLKPDLLNLLPIDPFSGLRGDLLTAVRHLSVACHNNDPNNNACLAQDIFAIAVPLVVTPQVCTSMREDWAIIRCKAMSQHVVKQGEQAKTHQDLISVAKHVQKTLDPNLIDAQSPETKNARSEIAIALRDLAIRSFNEFDDGELATSLTSFAAQFASDDATKVRLAEDIRQLAEATVHLDWKKYLVEHMHKRVSEVIVSGKSAVVPALCTCCLAKPDSEQTVSYNWQETRGMTRYKRSRSFAFPVCAACRQHQTDYLLKRWCVVLLASFASTLFLWWIAGKINQPEFILFALGGAVLTGGLLFAAGSIIRVKLLPDCHACRSEAVAMFGASDAHCKFRFQNPVYGDAFARANKTHASLVLSKPPPGPYFLKGRALAMPLIGSLIIAFAGHAVVYTGMEDFWRQHPHASNAVVANVTPPVLLPSQMTQPPPNPAPVRSDPPPPQIVTPPRPAARIVMDSGLSLSIDAGKARAKELEADLTRMDGQIEVLSGWLDRYKRDIDDYDRRVALGLEVNRTLYQQAIDRHNGTVVQYNALLEDRRAKYVTYEAEIDAVNAMVVRFNRGER